VRDLDAAMTFFLETLSGEVLSDERIALPQPGRQLRLLLGDTKIALIAADDPSAGPIGAYFSRPVSGIFALVWEVDSLSAVREHMRQIGMPLVAPLLSREGVALDSAGMMGARHEFIVPG
jgi:hypothetical protein